MNKNALQVAVVDRFYSRDGYLVQFDSSRWELSKDIAIPVGSLSQYLGERDYSFRRVLEFYARAGAPSHARNIFNRFLHYCEQMQGSELLSVASLISYRSSLDRKTEWYMGVLRGAIRQWSRLGYPGISDEVLTLLNKWVIKGNEKGFAVQSMCPDAGPLTDIELQGVISAVVDAFTGQRLSLEETCLSMILAMTGRRPGQIAALKVKDLQSTAPRAYWINFPRAKQRNTPWRSSFNRFAIVEELWLLLQQQAESVKTAFSEQAGGPLPQKVQDELPFFPVSHSLETDSDVEALLGSDRLHIPSQEVYQAMLGVARTIAVISERTGAPIALNPNRFRYTLGTNLAREGRGELVIAEALDHSDTQNVGVYVKNIPEIVERIDKAVALQLAPFAQAFRGVLVTSEREARRGDDPSSRISNGRANVGTCGRYGFCGALAPIACYTCAHFQPWLDGPHEEVLDRLIEERDRVRENCGDLKIASTNDRLILAVSDVINRCKEARGEVVYG
ncbi:tyrosine-type recombinase/integrase [Pseudomonas putida]|uniref:site-specific integrase n=1 Tax=Pseudomonas TaxID=286 RepID=UPI0011983528|nr:site-specific integrase [Pseudomonas putida]EKT4562194.1 tyrosine-type recombinase/integrase [Pseudomonas putida]MDP9540687.1 site-specific integrase [Pseudomonas putida]QDY40224.1 DNA breaking-rejoining enzyme [Pseudomonas putida]